MTSPALFILLSGALIIIGAVLVWRVARRFRGELGMGMPDREKSTDTSFIINAFQDVTRQLKEKERELERLKGLAEQRAETVESYTENILQCVTNGVMTFDGNCRLTTINRAAEEMLEMVRDEVVGKHCTDLFGEGAISKGVTDTLTNRHASARLEATLDRPKGTIWLGFNTAMLTDRRNAELGVILSFSDLTEVKRLQAQMELRERLTALGEMSAGIAHELRNPMAVISGYLTLLSKKTDGSGQDTIRSISAEIDGMNRIIGDLLTFARPASLNRVMVNVREMIEGCLGTLLATKDPDKRIRIVLNLEDVSVPLDEVLMRQTLANLIQNGLEAMQGEGTLTIEMRKDRDLKIRIQDTGAGIAANNIKKIFLPFFTTKDTGVGMGLALAHKVITSHGGRVEVKSKEEKGTTFIIVLPLRE
jgi:PAS domain S-box-containing protein